ncbi:large ribosomal subunit protein eL22 [Drosophila takahashii]|uniref:large ribosomal subunit protein eL22 n=1 Tax=Drosophila takahashii TaxID=29030 RepID=UPI001CF8D1F1|nr:60S ribosomal protein L22 [Drosophila takahashii]
MKPLTGKKKGAFSRATETPKKAQAKVATPEAAAPAKSSAPPVSSKKVAKAPAVALKNLELARKESAIKIAENAVSSAKKAAETSGKKLGAISETSAPLHVKKRSAPPTRENARKPAAKKVSPIQPPKEKSPPAPKPEKKEVVAPKPEPAPETTGKKAAAPAKPKPKPKRPKNVLRGKRMAKKKVWQRFVIDCDCVAEDLILDVADFEKYLKTHIKVKNKINQLNDLVTFERIKNSSLVIHTAVHFSKRYFKYLAKRYLKKHSLRDWVRVVSTGKETFTMRYFKIQGQDDDDDDDEPVAKTKL